jgi:hypothetical protein
LLFAHPSLPKPTRLKSSEHSLRSRLFNSMVVFSVFVFSLDCFRLPRRGAP